MGRGCPPWSESSSASLGCSCSETFYHRGDKMHCFLFCQMVSRRPERLWAPALLQMFGTPAPQLFSECWKVWILTEVPLHLACLDFSSRGGAHIGSCSQGKEESEDFVFASEYSAL